LITFFSERWPVPRWFVGLLLVYTFLSEWRLVRACADEPELTSLVGENVGLCVEIRDLRSHIREVPSSEWFRRLRELSLVKRWQEGSEFARWQSGQASLSALLGQPLDEFASELFGESVVLAVSPSPSGPPMAMLLSRAAKDDSWDRVLTLWDQLEAHDVQTKSAFGRSFQVRRKKTNGRTTGPVLFTLKLGRTLAISEREELIRDVLARATPASNDSREKPLDQSPSFRRAMSSLPDKSAVRVFANPRRWDDELRKDAALTAWLMPPWKKLEWLSAGLEVRDGLVFHAVAHHDTTNLPTIWQQFVAGSESPSNLATRLPAEALLAGEARIASDLCRWLRTLDPSEKSQRDWQTFGKVTRGVLGRDLFDEVLPHAKPSLGGAIVPKKPVAEHSAPVDGLLAWQFDLSPGQPTGDDQPNLRESLDGALLTLMNVAAVAQNSRNPDSPATLKVQHRESLTLKWLDQLPPYRPAYGITAEHLLLATDPRLISAFHDRSAGEATLDSEPLFATVRSRHFSDHSHWLFVNSRTTREFLNEQHEPLSRQVGYWRKLAPPSVTGQLRRVQELLTPFDAAFLAAKVTSGEVRFTAGAVTPDPQR
jgi:hypothetical protein